MEFSDLIKNYYVIDSYNKSLERRLRYLTTHPLSSEHGVVTGSRKSYPFIGCHFVVSAPNVKSDEERNKAIKQLVINLAGNKQLFEDVKLDIDEYIEKMQNIEHRTILRMKYIDQMTDEQIGEELGFSRSTITKKIEKILSEIKDSHISHL